MVKSRRIDSYFKRKVDENQEGNKRHKVSSQSEPQSQEQENSQGPQSQQPQSENLSFQDLPSKPLMASSSSRGHNKSYKYNVFLSFRGEDTRKNFVDHLYAALDRQGIYTFKDDERLERGKEISDGLLRAIEDSRFYIIVFSKRYTSSSWYLNELLKIMECHKTDGHAAFPVFYDVDPSEVRKQTGSVGEAFATHKNESEVAKWREALKEAACLSGLDVKQTANGHEAKVIEMIVEWVSLESRPFDIHVDENLIGMEQRVQDLDLFLKIGLKDVLMVGIKGMGGAGKTTLARALFDDISIKFEGKSFVENVREKAKLGLEKLQEQILRDILKDKSITVSGVLEGKNLMRNRLPGKEVLVVLDDVDHREQLEMLAGDPTWFKPGSRVIITTRDGEVLEEHNVKRIHDVNLLSDEEAMRLFSRHAFGKDSPTQGYEKHSHEVVSYAAGLPLTVKVLGSKLCGKDDKQWRYTLERLDTIPLEETLKKLELSYESLEKEHKELFLHVACFLRGWKKDNAICMLESCGLHAEYGLRVLEQKSLIVTNGAFIDMHDHIEEMGKNIAGREHMDEPHKRTRLWNQKDIEDILADNSVRKGTRCINLRITPGICLEALRNMNQLTCFIVDENVFKYGYDSNEPCVHFPDSLRYLYWYGYPHSSLPKTFEANNLVALIMPCSRIEQLWEGGKVMGKLRFLNLGDSKLRSLDLGLTPNLERLDLKKCEQLEEVKMHDVSLKSLVYLDLHGCGSLEYIYFIEFLESLEVLNISYLDVTVFSYYIIIWYSNKSLLQLDLSSNEIEEIHSSIGNLHKLVSLDLSGCHRLKRLPGSICSLPNLRTLDLNTSGIEDLPEDIGQLKCLEYLDLSKTHVTRLPGSICMLKCLEILILRDCRVLEKLPEDVGELESLEILDLEYCYRLREIPSSICNLECLQLLNIKGTRITHLPHRIFLLNGLKIIMKEGQIIDDDDFIQLCCKYDSEKRQIQDFQQLRTIDLRRCHGIYEPPEALGQLECLEELDLSYTGVKRLPDGICMLKRLKKLFLESCKYLEKLPDDVVQLESLEVLNLSGCKKIKEIPSSTCMLKRLKKLILASCEYLEKVPDDVGQLESLEELNLSGFNKIREIPSSICMLKRLKKLFLERCSYLEKLPDDVGQLESLEELDLSRCRNIREIPSSICMLKSLKKLFLESCEYLEKLPDDVGRLESLEELNLSGCKKIKEIPSSICMLKRLKKPFLYGCEYLEKLPDDVCQLEYLEELDLSGCKKIKEIPSSICMLKRLEKLVLYGCEYFKKLPDDVGQLESLEELDLSRCYNIREIPSSICMLKRLKNLSLERCRYLKKLPDDVGQLESLEGLNLSMCYDIREIPSSICMLKRLKKLILAGCEYLEKLPDDVGQLESLEELDLSECKKIREIPSSICMLKHLRTLNLRTCCRLQILPDRLGDLKSLGLLNIFFSGINHLPKSISLLNHLTIRGSKSQTNRQHPSN